MSIPLSDASVISSGHRDSGSSGERNARGGGTKDVDPAGAMTDAFQPISQTEQRLKDYVAGAKRLFWQRQGIYLGAFLLSVFYYSVIVGILCYLLILLTELFDHYVAQQISAWNDHAPEKARKFSRLITIGTVANTFSIALFIMLVTWIEGISPHFTPLLFLFSAALFAAINNHQIIHVLVIRLAIYAAIFLFVAAKNIVVTGAPLTSVYWLHFFTVVFVLFFILDCSFTFLKMYRHNLAQIETLRREHEAAMAANRAKSEFLSVVSHELRTPITSIKGPLNLATSGALGEIPENLRHMLTVANKNSNRLASLIDDLLDLQALDAGKMAMGFRPLDLAALVFEAIEANGDYLKDRQVSVTGTGIDRPVTVTGDAKRLMQVMANVLSNAIKFSNQGGAVEVELATEANEVCISVTDHGRGIPEGAEDQVFAPFSQIDSSDHRSIGGTGLGMTISRRIVERHGGTIDYLSKLGSGSTFNVRLPLYKEPG